MLAWARSLTKRRLRVVDVVVGPVGEQVEVERRAAGRAAAGGLPAELLPDGGHGLQRPGLDQAADVLVGQVGASAHRLGRRQDEGVAEGDGEHLLDEAGALAAGGGGLGGGAHLVERGQPARGDGLDDLALADAVAPADLCLIRQGCNGRHRVQRGPPGVGGAEDQRVALGRDVLLRLELGEEPRAVGRVAVEHRADDHVVLEDEALVDAARGVAEDDLLAARGVGEVAGGEQVAAGDLELGRELDRLEGGFLAEQGLRHHLRLVVERRDEAVEHAVDARRIRRSRGSLGRRCASRRRRRCRGRSRARRRVAMRVSGRMPTAITTMSARRPCRPPAAPPRRGCGRGSPWSGPCSGP